MDDINNINNILEVPKIEKEDIDKYEFYSFSIYIYSYGLFYLFIFEESFIRAIFLSILANIMSNYIFSHNIIKLLTHKYWRNNLNDIAMPQLISISTQLLTKNYSNYIIVPSNLIIYFFIKKIYKDEINYSFNLRIILLFIFFLYRFLF